MIKALLFSNTLEGRAIFALLVGLFGVVLVHSVFSLKKVTYQLIRLVTRV